MTSIRFEGTAPQMSDTPLLELVIAEVVLFAAVVTILIVVENMGAKYSDAEEGERSRKHKKAIIIGTILLTLVSFLYIGCSLYFLRELKEAQAGFGIIYGIIAVFAINAWPRLINHSWAKGEHSKKP